MQKAEHKSVQIASVVALREVVAADWGEGRPGIHCLCTLLHNLPLMQEVSPGFMGGLPLHEGRGAGGTCKA